MCKAVRKGASLSRFRRLKRFSEGQSGYAKGAQCVWRVFSHRDSSPAHICGRRNTPTGSNQRTDIPFAATNRHVQSVAEDPFQNTLDTAWGPNSSLTLSDGTQSGCDSDDGAGAALFVADILVGCTSL